jgi:CheY-like chemotaxis protein
MSEILVAEYNPVNLDLRVKILQEQAYRLRGAVSGCAARLNPAGRQHARHERVHDIPWMTEWGMGNIPSQAIAPN